MLTFSRFSWVSIKIATLRPFSYTFASLSLYMNYFSVVVVVVVSAVFMTVLLIVLLMLFESLSRGLTCKHFLAPCSDFYPLWYTALLFLWRFLNVLISMFMCFHLLFCPPWQTEYSMWWSLVFIDIGEWGGRRRPGEEHQRVKCTRVWLVRFLRFSKMLTTCPPYHRT